MGRLPELIFAFIGALLLIVGGIWFFYEQSAAAEAASWSRVTGRVVESHVTGPFEEAYYENGRRYTRTNYTYGIDVTYEYQVGGRTFTNDRVWPVGSQSWGDRSKAESLLRKYRAAGPVEVIYNPDNPRDAVLHAEPMLWPGLVFGGLGLLFLAGAGWAMWRR